MRNRDHNLSGPCEVKLFACPLFDGARVAPQSMDPVGERQVFLLKVADLRCQRIDLLALLTSREITTAPEQRIAEQHGCGKDRAYPDQQSATLFSLN